MYILKNKTLEIVIDHPTENYKFSRFDWTGKIREVKFHDISVSVPERTDNVNEDHFGRAFYNEFGMDAALGFEDAKVGEWFHKIGVGLLKKVKDQYDFTAPYEIRPANFDIKQEPNKVIINCKSETVNGYSYILRKEVILKENSFTIHYYLKNTGEKDIVTDEYIHNFLGINNEVMGSNYTLKLPFTLKPELFNANVNPEGKVAVVQNQFNFSGSPKDQFFYSNLSGSKLVRANWELINHKSNIGINETGSFETDKINLWGWHHVVSPELFHKISIKPGESEKWSRTYNLFKIN